VRLFLLQRTKIKKGFIAGFLIPAGKKEASDGNRRHVLTSETTKRKTYTYSHNRNTNSLLTTNLDSVLWNSEKVSTK
jgi:hypothetical protein